MICYFDWDRTEGGSVATVLFSFISAFCFSCYLVFIRRIFVSDGRMDIPLYLGKDIGSSLVAQAFDSIK